MATTTLRFGANGVPLHLTPERFAIWKNRCGLFSEYDELFDFSHNDTYFTIPNPSNNAETGNDDHIGDTGIKASRNEGNTNVIFPPQKGFDVTEEHWNALVYHIEHREGISPPKESDTVEWYIELIQLARYFDFKEMYNAYIAKTSSLLVMHSLI